MGRKLLHMVFALTIISAFCFQAGLAVELRNGENVSVPAGTTVSEDLAASGVNVAMDGTVKGDILLAGSQVSVSGKTAGSAMLAGSSVSSMGGVGNDLFAAGGQVNMTGSVADNAWLAGGTVTTAQTASVGRDLLVAGGTVVINSSVSRNLYAAGGDMTIGGTVGGSAHINADALRLGPNAVVKGDLVYSSPRKAVISQGAQIQGRTIYTPTRETRGEHGRGGGLGFLWVLSLISAYVTGAVLLALFPRMMTDSADTIWRSFWMSLLIGFLILVVVPVACFVLMITMVGIPLSLILMAVWLIMLYIANIVAALAVGRLIFRSTNRPQLSDYLALLVGIVLLWLVGLIPILGWLVGFMAFLVGLGGLGCHIYSGRRKQTEAGSS